MKVYVLECIDEYDGSVDTEVKVFETIKKAREYKQKLIDDDYQFIDDVKSLIDEGSEDCVYEDKPDLFYCYDSYNFSSKTITIDKQEVL